MRIMYVPTLCILQFYFKYNEVDISTNREKKYLMNKYHLSEPRWLEILVHWN